MSSCLVLSGLVLYCLVFHCIVFSCVALNCVVLSCVVLSCLSSWLVLACDCHVLSCLLSFFLSVSSSSSCFVLLIDVKVISGMEVCLNISKVERDESDNPKVPIMMKSTKVSLNGYAK